MNHRLRVAGEAPSASEWKACPICGGRPDGCFEALHRWVLACGDPTCRHHYAATAARGHGVQRGRDFGALTALYAERNSRLARALIKALDLGTGGRVLDFGAGAGHLAEALLGALPSARVTCVEADADTRAWLRERGLDAVANLESAGRGYDAGLMVEVIEHLDDPVPALRLLSSRLRSGAKLFLSTPCGRTRFGSRATSAYRTPEHVHFFTEQSLTRALRASSFGGIVFRDEMPMYPRPAGNAARARALAWRALRRLGEWIMGRRHLVVVAVRN
jgi:2-polyprenyl-3-methyl-5-hydroxy-6-metoxy-1,4-benzoquinol methylase